MAHAHWTGHPFVDAGLAALTAAVRKQRPEDLTPADLEVAVRELERILLSDQALGIGVAKAFSGPKKSLQWIFPNSELDNPANWQGKTTSEKAAAARRKFHDAVISELEKARQCLLISGGSETCAACGESYPVDFMEIRRKDKMPLLEGTVNFYPAFTYGIRVCGLCALAVRFLPISVMRIGGQNRLWFLHTQVSAISTLIAQHYGWEYFDRLIAANGPLDFFSSWETAGDAGTLLTLLCELLQQFGYQIRTIYESPLPTTAYVFSNDNRGGFVQALPVPNGLLRFLNRLSLASEKAMTRFQSELLKVAANLNDKDRKTRSGFVQSVARKLLAGDTVIGSCLDHDTPLLRGGWVAHRLYLREVRGMADEKLAILERLGLTIAQSDDAQKQINELRNAERSRLYGILLGYVRRGWLKHNEFYSLLPPNDPETASEIRDILLGVTYEWRRCSEQNEEFPPPRESSSLSSDEMLSRVQQIGGQLIDKLPNLPRWVAQLQSTRHAERIRGVYLHAVRSGAMSFSDFVFLAPLANRQHLWLMRDYLLAFLFERVAGNLPEEVEIVTGEEQTPSEAINGGAL